MFSIDLNRRIRSRMYGGVRGRRYSYLLLLDWRISFSFVDADIDRLMILRGHPPEGKFHYPRGIMFIAHHIFIQSVLQAADRNYIYSILPFVRIVSNPN